MNNKIAFFFPSYKIGGVEVMYSTIALKLIQMGCKIEIIDYERGTIREMLKHKDGINFVQYERGVSFKSESSVCITSLLYLPQARYIFPGNLKLIFWDDHPYNLIFFLRHTRLIRMFGINAFHLYSSLVKKHKVDYCKKILNTAMIKNGVAFMCYSNYSLNKKYFDIKNDPFYVPIPISFKNGISIKEKKSKTINCSYLGRLDTDKYHLCLDLMNDIIRFNKKNQLQLRLHIIGNGDKFKDIQNLAAKYPDYFILKGIITESKLNDYFLNNIDLSFAVGASALESAALGIPTVFLKGFSLKLKNSYLWVSDARYYELCLKSFHFKNYNETVFSFDQIITQFRSNQSQIGKNCYDYVKNNHSVTSTIEKLNFLIEKSQLTTHDLPVLENH